VKHLQTTVNSNMSTVHAGKIVTSTRGGM
jgi:hypothetical protein